MPARAAVLALTAAAAVVLVVHLGDRRSCDAARTGVVNPLFQGREPASLDRDLAALWADCHDADVLAQVSGVLTIAARRTDDAALRDRAAGLAREATRREPDAFLGWVALGQALARERPAAATAAYARARALNPRLHVTSLPP